MTHGSEHLQMKEERTKGRNVCVTHLAKPELPQWDTLFFFFFSCFSFLLFCFALLCLLVCFFWILLFPFKSVLFWRVARAEGWCGMGQWGERWALDAWLENHKEPIQVKNKVGLLYTFVTVDKKKEIGICYALKDKMILWKEQCPGSQKNWSNSAFTHSSNSLRDKDLLEFRCGIWQVR